MPSVVGLQRTLRVLAATPNGAATPVLAKALTSTQPSVRVGAAKAIAARSDVESHHELLLALPDCEADVREALQDEQIATRLRKAAIAAITGPEETLCQRTCRYAIESDDFRLLPPIVDKTVDPRHASVDSLAAAALQMARSLSARIEAKQTGEDQSNFDPAFARQGALQSLNRAIDRYGEHQRLEIVDAFLALTTYNNTTLRRILKDTSHAARPPVLEALQTSHGFGAMDVLIMAMEDADAPQQLLELAAGRQDSIFLSRMFGRFGEHPGIRVIQNARRLAGFAWAELSQREQLLELTGPEQSAAIRLFAAADTTPADRIALITLLMNRGKDEGRASACEALRRLKAPEVGDLLRKAMSDPCPEVVANAVVQLRRHSYENGLTELVTLLDHESPVVVAATQRALGEFSLESYQHAYDRLTPAQRATAGRLVGKADPELAKTINRDLRMPGTKVQLRTLRMIHDLGCVDRVLEAVIHATTSEDVGVRTEAVRALDSSQEKTAIEALTKALDDPSSSVRDAAQASLRQLDSLGVAESLVETLEREFDDNGSSSEGSSK
ncbi:MAG: HEAT repeat domain-containing protein [Planctomycetota bacterium]